VDGALVTIARRRAGISQTELARRVGRDVGTISRYERGERQLTVSTLRQLLAACGFDLTLGIAPADTSLDPLIRENLALPPARRLANAVRQAQAQHRLQVAGWRHRRRTDTT
jgi:transcriptional regulator with XRE-family HTH domain